MRKDKEHQYEELYEPPAPPPTPTRGTSCCSPQPLHAKTVPAPPLPPRRKSKKKPEKQTMSQYSGKPRRSPAYHPQPRMNDPRQVYGGVGEWCSIV